MAEHAAAELGTSYDCKQPGCTNSARSRVGRYSYCDEHRKAREEQQQRTGVPASLAGKLPKRATLADKVRELERAAKLADRARTEAAKFTEKALAAKAEADARERAFRELARELMGSEAGPAGNGRE